MDRNEQMHRLVASLVGLTQAGELRWESTDAPTTLRLERPSGTVLLIGPGLRTAVSGHELRFLDRDGNEVARHVDGLPGALSGYSSGGTGIPSGAIKELYDLAMEEANRPRPEIDSFLEDLGFS
jgi:hypothetical protein